MIIILILALVIIIFSWGLREREPVNEEKFNRREILFVKINSYFRILFLPFVELKKISYSWFFYIIETMERRIRKEFEEREREREKKEEFMHELGPS